jgi:hypothetical protein
MSQRERPSGHVLRVGRLLIFFTTRLSRRTGLRKASGRKVGCIRHFYLPGASCAGAPDRALRLRPEPPKGLGRSVSIPCAGAVLRMSVVVVLLLVVMVTTASLLCGTDTSGKMWPT